MTFLGLNVVERVVREVGTVLRFVELCDHQVIADRGNLVLQLHVVGDLTGAVNGMLVVTTKENINQKPRMFPSVVTYLVSYETVRLHRVVRKYVCHIQLQHGGNGFLYVLRPLALITLEFYALQL